MNELVRFAKEALRQQTSLNPIPTIQPGSWITWQGDEGTPRGPGTVDFLHPDADGAVWAFCTCPDGTWTAVNTKFIRVMTQ